MPVIAEIAERSGLAARKVRYVLDHDILPGGSQAGRGRGAPRHCTPFEAFGIVTAVLMLEAGLKRALVRECLEVLCRGEGKEVRTVPLFRAFMADEAARLEVGDWRFVRLSGSQRHSTKEFDTGWCPLAGATPTETYSPLLNVVIDVGQIRRKLNFKA